MSKGKAWTSKEDAVLEGFAQLLLPWNDIADVIPNRTISSCQDRWRILKKKNKLMVAADERRKEQNNYKNESCKSSGAAIGGDHYVFRVPAGDPLLQRLIATHGNDNIIRDVDLTRGLSK